MLKHRGRFRQFTSDELEKACHRTPIGLVVEVVAAFYLGTPNRSFTKDGKPLWTWTVPDDVVDLRGLDGWQALYERARRREEELEALREEERSIAEPALERIWDGGRGEVHVGDKYITNIKGSNVGNVAVGENASAAHGVASGAGLITRDDVNQQLGNALKALVDDEDQLERFHEGLYEALEQVLRLLRKVEIEQGEIGHVVAQLKNTADELWVEQVLPKLKDGALPSGLEVAKVIAASPVLAKLVELLATPA